MTAFCPNFSNKQVKKEFDELKGLFGEDWSYLLWHRNHGYSVNLTTRGSSSPLFQWFMELNGGNRDAALRDTATALLKDYKMWKAALQSAANIAAETQAIKEHAIADGTFMKAPNGKPTNLTEQQWLQVRTNAFKDWFGDWENDPANASKVVDENGEPLVMYHASKRKFTTFDREMINTGLGLIDEEADGFYFSTNPEVVKTKTNNIVYSVFLNARNIFDDNNYASDEFTKHSLNITAAATSSSRKIADSLLNRDRLSVGSNIYDELVVFEPNQIKSATDNIGTFSTEIDDIYYQESNNKTTSVDKRVPDNIKTEYKLNYDSEIQLQKTEEFNPYSYFKNRNYSILSEKSSRKFEKWRSVAKKHNKNDKYGYPILFFDEITGILYIKSNSYKNSRRYDVVNAKTGEIVKHGIILLTYDEVEESKYKISEEEKTVPKTFSPARSINFALLKLLPSKSRYKLLAKQFIYDAIDPKESTINFEIIDRFVDSMPDSLWDYISSDVYGFNKEIYLGPFYVGTTDTSNITAATSKIDTSDISINLPKLGLIKMVEEFTGIKLLGRTVRFDSRTMKLPNKKREWNEQVVLDNNLTRPEIEYFIKKILYEEYFKPSTEKLNIERYAKDTNQPVEQVMRFLQEDHDILDSQQADFIRNYDWLYIDFIRAIESKWNKIVTDYILKRYDGKFTKNQIPLIDLYFKGVLPWIQIDFNLDSGTSEFKKLDSETEPFIRLASVIHEPFHALHALSYGSKEELELRLAYNKLISTTFGKKLQQIVKDNLLHNVTEEGLYKEICAYIFLIINTPPEFILDYGPDFIAVKIYNLIKDIVESPTEIKTTTVTKESETIERKSEEISKQEELEIKLNFIQKLYNYLVSALHKIFPVLKQYLKLIDSVYTIKAYEILDVDSTSNDSVVFEESKIEQETERSKLLREHKEDFLNKLLEFEYTIKALLNIDSLVLSPANINLFFKKNKAYQESSTDAEDGYNHERALESVKRQYLSPQTQVGEIGLESDLMSQQDQINELNDIFKKIAPGYGISVYESPDGKITIQTKDSNMKKLKSDWKLRLKEFGYHFAGKPVYVSGKARVKVFKKIALPKVPNTVKPKSTRSVDQTHERDIKYYGNYQLMEQEQQHDADVDSEEFKQRYISPDTTVREVQFDTDLMSLNPQNANAPTNNVPQQPKLSYVSPNADVKMMVTFRVYNELEQIDRDRNEYVLNAINRRLSEFPDSTPEQLAKVRVNSRIQYNKTKLFEKSKLILRNLASLLGMSVSRNGYYELAGEAQLNRYIEYLINSLDENTYKAYVGDNIGKEASAQVGYAIEDGAPINIILDAVYNGRLDILNKELARAYVRIFWGSDLILAALKTLDTGNDTSEQLESKLVQAMTDENIAAKNSKLRQLINDIFNALQDLIQTIFNSVTINQTVKDEVLTAVNAAFIVAQDLEYSEGVSQIYDRAEGNYSTSPMLSEKDRLILKKIQDGLKVRLKSQLSRNVRDQRVIAELKSRLNLIESKDSDSIDDVFNIIQRAMEVANNEIGLTAYYIDGELLADPSMQSWDVDKINFVQQDLIGYYQDLLNQLNQLFVDKDSAINKYNQYRVANDPNALDLKNTLNLLQANLRDLLVMYLSQVVIPYVKKVCTDYVNLDDSIIEKETFIYNMTKWIEQDRAYGDLAGGEVIIGMASRSKSPIVRIVEKFMSEAEYDASRKVLKRGHDLVALYNKIRPIGSQISPYNYQKRFMEFDKDGIPTGYFIREVNQGQFYRDKDAKEQELRNKYGLTVDEDGNTVFPENEDATANDSVYNKYYDELDEWLDKHCERRYKLEYYKKRRRYLSPDTIKAINEIQYRIDLILDRARDSRGYVDRRKLTQNERYELSQLRKNKRDLGSHYIFTDTGGGILHVEEKTGDALRMAEQISKWNIYLRDKVKYNPDWRSFEDAKQAILDLGGTQEDVDAFEKMNTTTRLTPEFYEVLKEAIGENITNEELTMLQKRHTEILNALKVREGAGSHNLNKLGLGLTTDRSGWAELLKIEQQMADVKKRLLEEVSVTTNNQRSIRFDDLAKLMYVTTDDTSNVRFLNYIINQWAAPRASNTDLNNVFAQLFTYIDEKGRKRYLKAFLYLSAKDFVVKLSDGRSIKCLDSLPSSEYSELDETSELVNENFVKGGESLQAKYDVYKNEAYDKLTTDELTFLGALLDTMEEAREKIPMGSKSDDLLLPQISGRTMSVVANSLHAGEISTALGYAFRKFGAKYAETEEDVTTNQDLARRPDGSVVNNIPVRFIRRLDNPNVLTTDVLGAVIMFYDMACNYESKSENLPTLELIKQAVDPKSGDPSNVMFEQYSKIEHLLDSRYYGKETTFGFRSDEKITKGKLKTILTFKTIRNMASLALLGVNFTTIEVGYLDALGAMIAEGFGGKYITLSDIGTSFILCILHTGRMLKGLGNPNVNDKLVAAMLYNQLSRSNSDIFKSTDQYRLDRFLKEHLLMGGYTITDYMINSMFLRATYNHYRLLTNPNTNKQQFMSKTDAINEFTKAGYTEKEAIKLWKKAKKTTLWDAYENKDGFFTLKQEYKGIVTKKLENRISGRLRDKTAQFNGIIPMTEKAKLQTNVFGSYITLMRNFYVNTYWDRFKTGGDLIKPEDDHTITWWGKQSEYHRDDLGMYNLETGEFEGAVFKDFFHGLGKLASNLKRGLMGQDLRKLNNIQKYAVRRSIAELAMIAGLLIGMLWSISWAREKDYDEDRELAWKLNIVGAGPFIEFNGNNVDKKLADWARWKTALLFTRTFNERLTPWWMPTAFEPLTSPTVAISYLDDIGVTFGLVADLFSQRADEDVKNGGYKGMTRGTRDVLKILSPLGFDNITRQWHTAGVKSTLKYYTGITPTKFIVPSQKEYDEEHKKSSKSGTPYWAM